MNHAAGGQALLFEVGEHAALEPLGFGEVGVRHVGGQIGVALAHVLQREADGYAAQVLPAIEAVHHLVHVQGIVLDVGGDTPDAVCDQRAMDVAGHGLLHDAALVVLLLGPRVGEEGPYANVGQPLLAGEQQRVGHAGVIDL